MPPLLLRILVLSLLGLLAPAARVRAQAPPGSAGGEMPRAAGAKDFISPDYPGLLKDGGVYFYARTLVSEGLRAYFRVYGRWPSSWREVRESGLFQVEIIAPDGSVLDPDDGRVDCYGDVAYLPPAEEGGCARYMQYRHPGSTELEYKTVFPTMAYARIAGELLKRGGGALLRRQREIYMGLVLDESLRKRLAICELLGFGTKIYMMVKMEVPQGLGDVLKAGLGPVDERSLNPSTGRPFKTEELPGEVHFVCCKVQWEENGGDGEAQPGILIDIVPVWQDGRPMSIPKEFLMLEEMPLE